MEFGVSNEQVAYLLRCVAASYTLRGIDRFRIIAYDRAADVIDHLGAELHDLWSSGTMSGIEGIGKILTERIEDYFENGKKSFLIHEFNQIPVNVYKLMQVPGIGPKTAFKLVVEFKLENSPDILKDIDELAKSDKISILTGFGKKSQDELITSIATFKNKKFETKRIRLDQAEAAYDRIIEYLKDDSRITIVYPVGSLRRFSPTVGDIDIVAVCKNEDSRGVISYFVKYPQASIIEGEGERKGAIILTSGIHIQLRTIEPHKLGAMLQYNTGSKEHNIRLREFALKKNYSLSEYGITTLENRKVHADDQMHYFSSEEDFYNFLGLQYVPPELRQGRGEIELARKKAIPDLIEISDVLGDFQMHTDYPIEPSHDLGANSCVELLEKGDELGYEYIAFTDHNPSIKNHTDSQVIDILRLRRKAIDKTLYKKTKRCKYFISLEVDVRPDGTMSIPLEATEHVDFILMSIHSSFSQSRQEMTKRILSAMDFPKVKIFAHPTTRLVGLRDEIDADWTQIFKKASAMKISLEINAAPERLDLPDNLIAQAYSQGCTFSLGTDSHNVSALLNMRYGVAMARRGCIPKHAIINTMDFTKVSNYLLSK